MPIKSIKKGGDIPSNQVGVATNPRAEYNLDELSFEGHSRLINSTAYTNKLNDALNGALIYQTFAIQPFTAALSDMRQINNNQETDDFQDIKAKDGFIIAGAPFYDEMYSSFSNSVNMGRVYIWKEDGTHWGTIPSPSTTNNTLFGFSVDIDPGAGKVFVGVLRHGNSGGGQVYVYDWDGSQKFTTSDWGTPTIIQASDRTNNQADYFGFLIKTINTNSGNKLIVSATRASPQGYGRVYVYNYDGTGEVSIVPSDSHYSDLTLYFASDSVEFGCSIDVDGNPTDGYKLAVGCCNWRSDGDNNRRGAVFIFNLDGTGEQMILPARLTNNLSISDAGHNVAIDVAAGKVISAAPNTDNSDYGFGVERRDHGVIQIMDLDGTNQVNILAPYVTPSGSPYGWPYESRFGLKLGINRNTRRLYALCRKMGTDGGRPSIVIMDYDSSNGGSAGSNTVTQVLLRPPGNTSATQPKYASMDDYPFYKGHVMGTAKPGQGQIINDATNYGSSSGEDPFYSMVNTTLSSYYGVSGGSKNFHVRDDGAVTMCHGGRVWPDGTRSSSVDDVGYGALVKGLDS